MFKDDHYVAKREHREELVRQGKDTEILAMYHSLCHTSYIQQWNNVFKTNITPFCPFPFCPLCVFCLFLSMWSEACSGCQPLSHALFSFWKKSSGEKPNKKNGIHNVT